MHIPYLLYPPVNPGDTMVYSLLRRRRIRRRDFLFALYRPHIFMDYLHIWYGHWLCQGHDTNQKWKCFDQRWPNGGHLGLGKYEVSQFAPLLASGHSRGFRIHNDRFLESGDPRWPPWRPSCLKSSLCDNSKSTCPIALKLYMVHR